MLSPCVCRVTISFKPTVLLPPERISVSQMIPSENWKGLFFSERAVTVALRAALRALPGVQETRRPDSQRDCPAFAVEKPAQTGHRIHRAHAKVRKWWKMEQVVTGLHPIDLKIF